ncbi:MAG: PilZ domain-containing protein [Desulfobulbaceae bacterium]|nr:PilZ domain-containing protein [Desulfobulbaceae bacterium]
MVDKKEKRNFSRVAATCFTRLIIKDTCYDDVKFRDMSLNGCFIEGNYGGEYCDKCFLKIYKKKGDAEPMIEIAARVVRGAGNEGMALTFVNVDEDMLNQLQTIILYATDNPLKVASEFVTDINIFTDDKCD